jgi:hypothetical protein
LHKLGDAITGRSPQRDLSHDKETLDYAAGALPKTELGRKTGRDEVLARIYERQGFHAKPEVVAPTELDRRIAAGWIEMHRGFGVNPDHVEAFRTGDEHYPGFGVHANGSYTSRDRSFADYARFEQGIEPEQWATVGRMALSPDARVVDLYGPEWKAWSDAQGDHPPTDEHAQVMDDFGRYAALRGYDAVRIPGGYQSDRGFDSAQDMTPGPSDHYAILNRGAVAVQTQAEVHPFDRHDRPEMGGSGTPAYMVGAKFIDAPDLIKNKKLQGAVEVFDLKTKTWMSYAEAHRTWLTGDSGNLMIRKRP